MSGDDIPRESPKAAAAFSDYVAMGPGRSLRVLVARYRAQSAIRPPTRRLETLADWSRRYRWQERLSAAITARTNEALAEAAELDAQSFLRTSRLVMLALASNEIPLDALLKLREAVRRPEPRNAGVNVNLVALHGIVERVAARRGLDPAEVLAEAEQILREGEA